MKIAFHENELCLRGTSVALYDYAYYNKLLLGNESIIISKRNHPYTDPLAVEKFSKEFNVYFYDNIDEMKKIVDDNKCDAFYVIKSGENDGVLSNVKNLIHVVFGNVDIHGDVYAFVSKWLSDFFPQYNLPYVPHIVSVHETEDNLRNDLNIPKDSIVFGRSGGCDTFDIQFVKDAIQELLNERVDVYFLFLNTQRFISHDRVIYLNSIVDLEQKTKFINTCDAMIHARRQGETFGLAIAEFSMKNKPIITWNGSHEGCHYQILGDKGLYYNTKEDFKNIILNFKKQDGDFNMYKEFTPDKVMEKFKQVFL